MDEIKKQLEDVKATVSQAIAKLEGINANADAFVDKGLDAVEKSAYSLWIVSGIGVGMFALGWFGHSAYALIAG